VKKLTIILTIIIYGCDEIKFPQYMLLSKKKSTEEIAEEFKAFDDAQSLMVSVLIFLYLNYIIL